jgi:Tfp pilus assembly protein PilN
LNNLATRPFYNERGTHVAIGMLAAVVLAVTVFNLWEVFALSGRHAQLRAVITKSENRAHALHREAVSIRRSLSANEMDRTITAAREANALIDRRVFSWTALFNEFEATLPDNVRIASVRPRIERDGSMTLLMAVVARNVDGINTFIENLERQGTFRNVISREEFVNEAGLLQASLQGQYVPPAAAPAPARGTGQ